MSSHANRGMALEELINYSNEVYRNKHMAVVYKRPTPVKILHTRGTKVDGYLEAASTVDYEGVYNGRSLQFEAKSTKKMDRFDLSAFQEHQIEHMRACLNQGAVVFALVEFATRDQVFYVPGKLILNVWDKHKKSGGRASIASEDLSAQCSLVRTGRGVPLDYIAVVDKVLARKSA